MLMWKGFNMAGTFPRYRLYASDGSTLVYEFERVLDDNGAFRDPSDSVEIGGLRGVGSIIIPGSEEAFDINITFVLVGEDYEDIVAQMNSVKSSIVKFTRYILKIDLSPSTTQDYYVTRKASLEFPLDFSQKRVTIQKVICVLRANTWSN